MLHLSIVSKIFYIKSIFFPLSIYILPIILSFTTSPFYTHQAGGSAPELTTSLIGTFLSESDVGFGTIVGSAVFNVLFVIGMCAVFSKEVLKLTWWPLFRDSTYYIMALGLLALFFGGPTQESKFLIEFWEALILFLAYIGYVVVMKFNVQLQKKVTKCFGAKTTVPHNDAGEASAQYIDGSPDKAGTKAQTTDELNIPAGTDTTTTPKIINGNVIQMLPQNPLLRPANFRVGVLQMVLKEQDPEEQIRVKVVAQIVGDVHDTFSAIDSNGTDTIDKEEFRELIRQLSGGGLSTDEIKETSDEVFNTIDLDGNKEVRQEGPFCCCYSQVCLALILIVVLFLSMCVQINFIHHRYRSMNFNNGI